MDEARSGRRGPRAVSAGDILSLAFGRRLAWITCILMFPIGMVALTSEFAPGRINAFARNHPDAMTGIGLAVVAAVGVLLWAAWGLTRCRKGSWTTTVIILAGWSLLVSFGLGDSSLRPGVFIEWAVTLPGIGLLLRRGAREAYRQGSARDMPKF